MVQYHIGTILSIHMSVEKFTKIEWRKIITYMYPIGFNNERTIVLSYRPNMIIVRTFTGTK